MNEYRAIGAVIRAYRKKRLMTQATLAELMEVPQDKISKWETGSAYISVVSLFKFCEIVDISLDEFFKTFKGARFKTILRIEV